MKCKYCSKELKTKGKSHETYCKSNSKRKSRGGKHNPNFGKKGANQYTYGAIMLEETKKKILKTRGNFKHSEESKAKISEKLSKNNKGGRCKWFKYAKEDGKVFNLQGTYEYRFAKILDIIEPDWIKVGIGTVGKSFKYSLDGKERTYTPDFYIPSKDVYYEVKGYWWGNDKEKMRKVQELNKNLTIKVVELIDLEKYEKNYNKG